MNQGVKQSVVTQRKLRKQADGLEILVVTSAKQIPAGMDQGLLAIDMQPYPGSILMININKRAFLISDQLIIAIAKGEVIEAKLFEGGREEFLAVVGGT